MTFEYVSRHPIELAVGLKCHVRSTSRAMYGHGRVLPPGGRGPEHAKAMSRLLLVKAARRLRRDGWYASALWLSLDTRAGTVQRSTTLPALRDYQAVLDALEGLWAGLLPDMERRAQIFRVHVALLKLSPANERQLDLLLNDDPARRKWEAASVAIDRINAKYGRTLASVGPWQPPPGGHAGGKISYTRIPRAEDFW